MSIAQGLRALTAIAILYLFYGLILGEERLTVNVTTVSPQTLTTTTTTTTKVTKETSISSSSATIDEAFDLLTQFDSWNEENVNEDDTELDSEDNNESNEHIKDNKNDPLLEANQSLLRARPRNLSLVFIGDSITRYQYLSLSYWLRYGRWFDPLTYPNNLVNAHSFHHHFHPQEDWNEFFMQSNRMLQPYELCDCARRKEYQVAIERRYFHDASRNNTLVYLNIAGKSTLGHEGLYGRVSPENVFGGNFTFGLLDDLDNRNAWEYHTWGDLIRYHIGKMNLGPSAVAILNAGLHPNSFHDSLRAVDLEVALNDVGVRGVWKTTSFKKHELLASGGNGHSRSDVDNIDKSLCMTLEECFDLSWMVNMDPDMYYDEFHFDEPVYRILNEDLLNMLGKLPENYEPLDRSILFPLNRQVPSKKR